MNSRKLTIQYIVFDLLAALLVWLLFMVFRKTINDAQLFPDVPIFLSNYDFVAGFFYFPAICVFVHYMSGIYLRPLRQEWVGIGFATFISSAIVSISVFFALMLDDKVVSYKYYYYSLFVLFGLLFILTSIPRWIQTAYIQKKYKKKIITFPSLIIGTGENAFNTMENLESHSRENTLVGFLSVGMPKQRVPSSRIIGKYEEIERIIKEYKVADVIIALDDPDEKTLFDIINSLYHFDVHIRFTPRLYEILTGGPRIRMMGHSPLVNISDLNTPDWQLSIKRMLDIAVSLVMLIFLTPLFLILAVRIKKDSAGPVFYRQERVGLGGKIFHIIKFRTMTRDAETGVPQLSSANDSRITPMGKVLRRYRLDELPQLWNILRGDMSIVGPRPERRFFIDQILVKAPYYCLLYKVRPGLTSWGPIRVGYTDTLEKMVERLHYDIIYMENMSLWNDVKILVQTLEIIFKGKGI